MKRIGALRLALTFSGCFLGAGYVSGQELWQFFGQYGKNGIFGLVLALIILGAVSAVTVLLSRRIESAETERLIISGDRPVLRWAVFFLETLFLFSVCIIMTAGVGALCREVFGLPTWCGCLAFIIIVTLISFSGLKGMVNAFSATVPVLIIVTLIFGIRSLFNGITIDASPTMEQVNPLLMFWPLAAILFACYNVFGSIAILAPLGQYIKKNHTVMFGVIIGVAFLFLIAFSVLISVSAAGTQASELPMLSLALSMSRVWGTVYAVLLLLAMFGTCLSSLVTFTRTITEKWQRMNRTWFQIICSSVIFFGSLFGFGDLIGVIYPLFGYCSSIFIVMLVINFLRVKNHRDQIKEI